jgi:hypothetical protein
VAEADAETSDDERHCLGYPEVPGADGNDRGDEEQLNTEQFEVGEIKHGPYANPRGVGEEGNCVPWRAPATASAFVDIGCNPDSRRAFTGPCSSADRAVERLCDLLALDGGNASQLPDLVIRKIRLRL